MVILLWMLSRRCLWLAGCLTILASATLIRAEQAPPATVRPGAISADESSGISQGWALLTQGRAGQAADVAGAVLAKYPNNLAALVLAVEADVAATGAEAGLARYETWLGPRTLEEPWILRTIARASLIEISYDSQNPAAQVAALKALVDAGEPTAGEHARQQFPPGSLAGLSVRADLGDEEAVKRLIADLRSGKGSKVGLIEALGASGNPIMIEPLAQQLTDPEPAVRGAAAEALGRVGSADAIPHLKAALGDSSGYVRTLAAGALYRLGDGAGLPVLLELATSEYPSGRLAAAEALASRPDANWLPLVRELTTTEHEPDIRLSAARLLAHQDPDAARTVLNDLATSDNPAIREEAVRALAAAVPSDLSALRLLLRHADPMVRITAAKKLLALTR